MIPIFREMPGLKGKIPFTPLSDYPTPLEKMKKLGREAGLSELYVKRDDLTGKIYGGNKIRKLEFVLAKALKDKRREVLTYGFAGSNHALATAVSANLLGLRSISMLMDQINANYIRENLLMSYHSGAELHMKNDFPELMRATKTQKLLHLLKVGKAPQVIPPGASEPLGTLGFINAAFELKKQVEEGLMPEPDFLYVGLGTCGTAVGLMIGLEVAGLKTKVMPVSVVLKSFTDETKVANHFNETVRFLRSFDSSLPEIELRKDQVEIYSEYLGGNYAQFTEEGVEAVRLAGKTEGLKLDGTYTGKVMSALLDHAKKGKLKGKSVLFWNTKNSRDFSAAIRGIDHKKLPEAFHKYFEHNTQPLDSYRNGSYHKQIKN